MCLFPFKPVLSSSVGFCKFCYRFCQFFFTFSPFFADFSIIFSHSVFKVVMLVCKKALGFSLPDKLLNLVLEILLFF